MSVLFVVEYSFFTRNKLQLSWFQKSAALFGFNSEQKEKVLCSNNVLTTKHYSQYYIIAFKHTKLSCYMVQTLSSSFVQDSDIDVNMCNIY